MAKLKDDTTAGKSPAVVYRGPEYRRGIQLPRKQDLIRPAQFTAKERVQFLQAHPEYAQWWVSEEA